LSSFAVRYELKMKKIKTVEREREREREKERERAQLGRPFFTLQEIENNLNRDS
jgi:hypothetical protein